MNVKNYLIETSFNGLGLQWYPFYYTNQNKSANFVIVKAKSWWDSGSKREFK